MGRTMIPTTSSDRLLVTPMGCLMQPFRINALSSPSLSRHNGNGNGHGHRTMYLGSEWGLQQWHGLSSSVGPGHRRRSDEDL